MRHQENPTLKEVNLSAEDDFKLIHGIGASVESRLHKAGILTFAQLADQTPQEIAKILDSMVGFTPERINDQDWTGQAMQYASKSGISGHESNQSNSQNHQHYELFTLELLMDDENIVRRTSVTHIQSKEKELWAGWDGNRLQDFIIERGSILISGNEEVVGGDKETVTTSLEEISEPSQPLVKKGESVSYKFNRNIIDQVRILDLEPHYAGFGAGKKRAIPENQSFNLRITLDLEKMDTPLDDPFSYLAAIYARKVGADVQQNIGTSKGVFMPADNVIIDIGAQPLTRGSYRMDVVVTLSLPETESLPKTVLGVISEGTVIHVY